MNININFLLATAQETQEPGFWQARGYGLLIGLAFLVAIGGAFLMLRYKKYNSDILFDLILVCIPIALIGLRLHFVIFDHRSFAWWFENGRIFGFERDAGGNLEFAGLSGLAIYGGLIAGALAAFLGKKLHNRKFKDKPHKQMTILQIYDLFFILIILGQVIGRWGNIANGELLGRRVYDVRWQRLPFAARERDARGFLTGNWGLALPLYESFLNLIGFGIMAWMFFGKRKSFDGAIFAVYCIWYGTVRTILEPMRQSQNIMRLWNGGPAINLLISVGILLLGVGIIFMHIARANLWDKKFILFMKQKVFKRKDEDIQNAVVEGEKKRVFLFVKRENLSEHYYGYNKTIEYLLANAKEEDAPGASGAGADDGGGAGASGFSFCEQTSVSVIASDGEQCHAEDGSGDRADMIDDDNKQFID